MLVIAGLVLGALGGAWFARRKGGAGFDIAQYAAGLGILFGILGLFATLILDRLI
ncbi:hypothetical protein [Falsigemmobacter faecalis]|uniref:hypothetical protein n=1 Tax=Falsigemmobacter faecalis TaxID=2488730 RepID=UPI0018F33BC7|nr:hypothetical protein [Falsigemmobacter faecalis]